MELLCLIFGPQVNDNAHGAPSTLLSADCGYDAGTNGFSDLQYSQGWRIYSPPFPRTFVMKLEGSIYSNED